VAQSDWPDECPDLFQSLLALLSSGNADTVDGAMRVFAEFTKSELSEEQLLPVLRELLPVLMAILGSPDVSIYSNILIPLIRFAEKLGLDTSARALGVCTMRRCALYG
jgi:hypothetical protein